MRSIRESRPALEIAALLGYARSDKFLARVEQALAIIRQGLEHAPDAYVATGMGKDSSVVSHLARSIAPNITHRMYRYVESDALDNFSEILAAWHERGVDVEVFDLHRAGVWDRTRAKNAMNPDQRGGVMLGLRADESRARRMSLGQYGPIHQYVDSGVWRIAPIAKWQTRDVAAYVVLHDLPMLDTYHRHGFEARTAAKIPVQNLDMRSVALNRLRQDNPAGYAELRRIWPEVDEWM